MHPFKIKITETLVEYVNVSASDEHEAIKKVKKQYSNADIILDAENYQGTKFTCENIYTYSVARYKERAIIAARSQQEALRIAIADSLRGTENRKEDWKESEHDGHIWNVTKIF